MAWPRALALLLTLTACTSGSTPTAAPPSPSSTPPALSSTPPTPTSTDLDEASANPEPSYRPLAASESLGGFAPTSVSFVSTRTGWFLGTKACEADVCGVLLQTQDGGRTFLRRNAPPVNVTSVRFADADEGWAYGNGGFDTQGDPGLWRTHDGGRTWKKVLSNPVPSLEVAGGSVWAIVLDLGRTFPQVFRGAVHGDALRLVTQAGNRSATLTVGGSAVYVAAEQGDGPIATTLLVIEPDRLRHRRESPCRGPYEEGLGASTLQLAAGRSGRLIAVCSGEPSAGNQFKVAYRSADGGRTWTRLPNPPGVGYAGGAGSVALTSTGAFMTGFRSQLNKEVGAGRWRVVLDNDEGLGFEYVGFTDDAHGVVLGAYPDSGAWMTDDAGEHWRRLRFH
ncbi:MAG: hypothetical protein QOJ79_2175 [Actinomycetota bacterium]|jgi:hypothetical protein|nr:hypothetical protein [Actinomycetota bacterium]